MIVRELISKLGFDFDGSGAAKADTAFEKLKGVLTVVAGAAAAVGAALSAAILETAATADRIRDTAQRIGTTTQALQELEFAAGTSGSSAEGLRSGLEFLNRALYDAGQGGVEAQESFAALGVSIRDGAGKLKPAEAVFEEIATKFAGMDDTQKKVALSMKLLGRGGKELVPLLNEGGEGIRKLRQEAHDLGLVLSNETVDSGDRVWEAFERIKLAALGLGRTIAAPLLEPVAELLEKMVALAKAGIAIVKLNLPKYFERLAAAVKVLAALVGGYFLARMALATAAFITQAMAANVLGAGLVNLGILYTGLGIIAVQNAYRAAAAWVVATWPVIGLGLAIAVLILVLEDLWVALNDGDSLIGELGPKWTKFYTGLLAANPKAPWWLKWLEDLKTILRVLSDLEGAWMKVKSAVGVKETYDPNSAEAVAQKRKTWKAMHGNEPMPGERLEDILGPKPSTALSDILGGLSSAPGQATAPPSVAPSPRAGKTVVAQSTINQTINASPGMDEETLAAKAGEHVDRAIDTRLREAQAATR